MSSRLLARTAGLRYLRLWCLTILAIVTATGGIGCGGGSAEPLPVRQMLERVKARAVQKEGRFETLSFRQSKLTDDDLRVVHGLSRLRVLELYGTDTTDRGVAVLRDLPRLEGLGLSKTGITDEGLAGLERFPKLRTLYLIDTAISDAGLLHLHQLKSLEVVDASGTRVTAEGIDSLRTALPRCDIKWSAPGTDRPALPSAESSNAAAVPPTSTDPIRREPSASTKIRPPANVVPPARPADIDANLELSWVTPDGAGGVVLPRLNDWHGPTDSTNSRFRRLVGILLDDDESEIIFLGVDEPNWPLMSAEDLLDGLAVAVESLKAGQPPGVTFEPMAESLSRPPRDQDPLRVEYFGAAANTVVGQASFEADRMMKCLSAGKDNLTGLPVRSAVAGWRSELDRVLESPQGKSAAWHRFWIEPTEGSVRNCLDGRLLLAELQLAVQTRFQIVRNGKLVDAPQQADSAAKAFAGMLTSRYREFAGEQPSFALTHNFAVLTSLAGAMLDPSSKGRWARLVEHVAEHRPRSVETPDTTPSMVVRAERKAGSTTHTAQIAGGVVLRPVKMRVDDSPELHQLRQQVLAARPATKARAVWTVNDATRPIEAVSANWRRRRHVWQADCRSGSLQLVRELVHSESRADGGDRWELQTPQLRIDRTPVETANGPAVWRSVEVSDANGQWRRLAPGEVTLPIASGKTPAYLSEDKSHFLALYRNAWMQIDEPVRFVSTNGGPAHPVPEGNGRLIEFSPDAPHHVRRILTAEGSTEYEWTGDRLTRIRRPPAEIRLRYDEKHLVEAVTDRGESIRYHYSGDDLRLVSHDGRSQAGYDYDAGHRLMRVSLPPGTNVISAIAPARQLGIEVRPARAEVRKVERDAAAAGLASLSIRLTEKATMQLVLNDGDVLYETSVDSLGNFPVEAAAAVRAKYARIPADQPLVISGPLLERGRLAFHLRSGFPDRQITVTADLERAQANLANGAMSGRGMRHEAVTTGLDKYVARELDQIPIGNADAAVCVISGHNDGVGKAVDQRLESLISGRQLSGRCAIVSSCFDKNLGVRIDALIAEGGAHAVFGFLQQIDQRCLPMIAEQLHQRLGSIQQPLDHPTLYRVFNEVIEAVKAAKSAVMDKSDLDLLDLWYLQTYNDQFATPIHTG